MIIPNVAYITKIDDNGDLKIISSIYNTPIQTKPFKTKEEMELRHLQNFQKKLMNDGSEYNFDILERGDTGKRKRPDFFINRANTPVGIELTMFMLSNLRAEVKFFAKIKERLLEAYYSRRLRELAGLSFEIRFGDISENTPIQINDNELGQLIVAWNKILDHPFDTIRPLWAEDGTQLIDTKKTYPVGQGGSIKNGLIAWEVSGVTDGQLDALTDFGKQTGFEISHGSKSYSEEMVFNEFQNTIKRKDIECNKGLELLISSGLPDKDGWITTLEDMVVTEFISKLKIDKPQFLSRIFLDSRFRGNYFVIYDVNKPSSTFIK